MHKALKLFNMFHNGEKRRTSVITSHQLHFYTQKCILKTLNMPPSRCKEYGEDFWVENVEQEYNSTGNVIKFARNNTENSLEEESMCLITILSSLLVSPRTRMRVMKIMLLFIPQ